MIRVRRALISVSDKTGLLDFARGLEKLGIEIITTGGTATLLRAGGLKVVDVADYTGFPEILDGRVKTLHPKIHGGLLGLRDDPRHLKEMADMGIKPIDMVVANFYPFEKTTLKKNASLEECIANIDIGGPSMLRSAAKNYKSVAVVCDPSRYAEVLSELDNNSGILSDKVLTGLAIEVFERTSAYDNAIHAYLSGRYRTDNAFSSFPKELTLTFTKARDLRYGENPHQAAAFYARGRKTEGLAGLRQLHGKDLSFNNILDTQAAADIVQEYAAPAAVVIKHNNPTGIALDKTPRKAFQNALRCDPLSAFGGIIGFNRAVDEPAAKAIVNAGFMEGVVAPGFTPQALAVLKEKKNLRLLELDMASFPAEPYDFKKVAGGLLLQEKDTRALKDEELKTVTRLKPTKAQLAAMKFGWTFIKHVRSNAIALVKGTRTVGIGAGQTSRVDSALHAIRKAGPAAKGAVLISDAFLPKADTVTLAAKAGVAAIIQTGGSIADAEVIAEADKRKMAMVTTGLRHFKH